MTDVRDAVAEALASIDGHSGDGVPSWYLEEADEVLKRLRFNGYRVERISTENADG